MTAKNFVLLFTSFSLCLITFLFCQLVAENYFFDKFYYQKSLKFGYWPQSNTRIYFKDFDQRSQDIIPLLEQSIVPSEHTKKYFKVAVIGDSYIWGQGVKTNQRLTALLEKKLNQIKPTKVYSLASPGDNFFDNIIKYQRSLRSFGEMDLYIIGMVDNDLIYNPDYLYNSDKPLDTPSFIQNNSTDCSGAAIYMPKATDINSSFDFYAKAVDDSISPSSQNYCLFVKTLDLLPKDKTIFIDLVSLINQDPSRVGFSKTIKPKLSPLITFNIPDFSPLQYQDMVVSRSETGHPSISAHKIYTNSIFEKIISLPIWIKFSEGK